MARKSSGGRYSVLERLSKKHKRKSHKRKSHKRKSKKCKDGKSPWGKSKRCRKSYAERNPTTGRGWKECPGRTERHLNSSRCKTFAMHCPPGQVHMRKSYKCTEGNKYFRKLRKSYAVLRKSWMTLHRGIGKKEKYLRRKSRKSSRKSRSSRRSLRKSRRSSHSSKSSSWGVHKPRKSMAANNKIISSLLKSISVPVLPIISTPKPRRGSRVRKQRVL